MKKSLLLLASAALLLAGCAKEISDPAAEGGMVSCTFTADMQGDATKAVADGDGKGVNANRCVMEVYYGDELYTRQVAAVSSYKASFTTQLVSNRTYTVAFWADCVADATTASGLATDQYYTTDGEKGLQEVSLKGTYVGNNDARDAFFHTGSYKVAQAGSSFTATLYRPFAQINVITTDWDKVSKISALKPSGVDVTIANPLVKFNAVTGEASADASVSSLNYSADVYTSPAPVTPVSETEKTLSMDYLFASTDQAVIDIDWMATKTGNDNVEHSFTNIPYKRNHRTNIKGALLTTTGQWNVTVDPIWDEPEYDKTVVVTSIVQDIDGANTFVAANAGADEYNVTFSAEPNDSGTPDGSASSAAHALLTTPLATGNVMNVTVETDTKTLYVGDYPDQNTVTSLTTATTYAATVNLTVPVGKKIDNLIINAPSKSVYLNGQLVSSTGTLTNVESTTAAHTLVVEQGQKIGTLTVHQGGVEIHEKVSSDVATLVISEDAHDSNPVKFRNSEHLSQSVFDVIYKVTNGVVDHDYIDRPTWVEKANADVATDWDIVESVCMNVEKQIGYLNLADAFAEVEEGQTIKLLKDITGAAVLYNTNVNSTLDLDGHTYKVTSNGNNTSHRAIKITAGKLIVKNGTIDARNAVDGTDEKNDDNFYGTIRAEGGNVELYGLTLYNNHDWGMSIKVCCNWDESDNPIEPRYTGVVDGCTVISKVGGGLEAEGGNITVRNSTFTETGENPTYGYVATGLAVSYGGTVNVENTGFTTEGCYALYVYSSGGTINVNGGTFKGAEAVACVGHDDNSYPTTYGSVINVYGGKFDGTFKETTSSSRNKFSISGGIFSVEPDSKYIADGYKVVANEDEATKTEYPWTVAPAPAYLSGLFTVAMTDNYPYKSAKQVRFSKGNLYAKRSSSTSTDWTWGFYSNQYDYLNQTSATAGDTEIDLFCWGYDAEGSVNPIEETTRSFVDWGTIPTLPGNSEGNTIWRTLTGDEWECLINTRKAAGNSGGLGLANSFAKARVNGINGIILFPDGYNPDSSEQCNKGVRL